MFSLINDFKLHLFIISTADYFSDYLQLLISFIAVYLHKLTLLQKYLILSAP